MKRVFVFVITAMLLMVVYGCGNAQSHASHESSRYSQPQQSSFAENDSPYSSKEVKFGPVTAQIPNDWSEMSTDDSRKGFLDPNGRGCMLIIDGTHDMTSEQYESATEDELLEACKNVIKTDARNRNLDIRSEEVGEVYGHPGGMYVYKDEGGIVYEVRFMLLKDSSPSIVVGYYEDEYEELSSFFEYFLRSVKIDDGSGENNAAGTAGAMQSTQSGSSNSSVSLKNNSDLDVSFVSSDESGITLSFSSTDGNNWNVYPTAVEVNGQRYSASTDESKVKATVDGFEEDEAWLVFTVDRSNSVNVTFRVEGVTEYNSFKLTLDDQAYNNNGLNVLMKDLTVEVVRG